MYKNVVSWCVVVEWSGMELGVKVILHRRENGRGWSKAEKERKKDRVER